MTPPLFFVAVVPSGAVVELTGDEGRHAAVKRLERGELVLVGDGHGTLLTCTVERVERDRVELSVQARHVEPAPVPRLVVVQAVPKGERADLAVELLTELGADEVVPWESAHTISRWDGDRADKAIARWRRTAREAAKQSRRPWIPVITDLAKTAAVLDRIALASTALVLHEGAETGIGSVSLATAGELLLVVGPEGGISPDELAEFGAAGAAPVRLGAAVLRTSTAGGAALAALSLRLGRWQ